jgi:hypothetical protein
VPIIQHILFLSLRFSPHSSPRVNAKPTTASLKHDETQTCTHPAPFYAAYARTGPQADGSDTERTGWCPHYGSGSRLLSDVLKTGEDNETALRRSRLWISYGGVVNRVGVRRVEDCFPFPFSSRATSSSCLPPFHAREDHRSRVSSPSTR